MDVDVLTQNIAILIDAFTNNTNFSRVLAATETIGIDFINI